MNSTEVHLVVISIVLLALLNVASAVAVIVLMAQNVKLKLEVRRLKPESDNGRDNRKE